MHGTHECCTVLGYPHSMHGTQGCFPILGCSHSHAEQLRMLSHIGKPSLHAWNPWAIVYTGLFPLHAWNPEVLPHTWRAPTPRTEPMGGALCSAAGKAAPPPWDAEPHDLSQRAALSQHPHLPLQDRDAPSPALEALCPTAPNPSADPIPQHSSSPARGGEKEGRKQNNDRWQSH